MVGSSFSIACPNVILNTCVADVLSDFADQLEKADDFTAALKKLVKTTIREHKRIIFNGNNYSEEWVREAEKRGLLNLKATPDALAYYTSDKNVALFEKHGVLSKSELFSRYEIILENYCKQLHIEALTMLGMIRKEIIPAVCGYMRDLSTQALNKKQLGIGIELESTLLKKLSALSERLYEAAEELQKAADKESGFSGIQEEANYYKDVVLDRMQKARAVSDELEPCVGEKYWPFPSYSDLLFSVK